MPTTPDLIPSLKICARCPHFYKDYIEVFDVNDGHFMDSEHYWECKVIEGALFFEPAEPKEGGGVIELETKSLPLDCPYTLEQALNQEGAGEERWSDLLPLLKAKAMTQRAR